ncbi:MAG: hypothetical protein LBU61_02435, partial [Coriobacteriales bacterium]|nr:hypothetical protein [Coriobacteriales bacterium]
MRVKGTGSLQQVMSAVPDTWELILTLPKEPNTPKRSPKQEVCRVFEGDKQQANLALDKYKAEYTKRLESDSGNAIEARLQKARKPVKNSWQLVLSLIDGKR